MKIYIAGKYSAPTVDEKLHNTDLAMDAAIVLIEKGHDPIVPHLSHFLDMHAKKHGFEIQPEWYYRYDYHLLVICDALFFLSSSTGADKERAIMESLSRPIYTNLDQVPEV